MSLMGFERCPAGWNIPHCLVTKSNTYASHKPRGYPKSTVDGWNPAPFNMVNIPICTGFYAFQVVQDFFHQLYDIGKTCFRPSSFLHQQYAQGFYIFPMVRKGKNVFLVVILPLEDGRKSAPTQLQQIIRQTSHEFLKQRIWPHDQHQWDKNLLKPE